MACAARPLAPLRGGGCARPSHRRISPTTPRPPRPASSVRPHATPSSSPDSNPVFLAKLALVSFSGAAVIKYGSLFLNAPFHPDPALAATLVLAPTAAYWGLLAVQAAAGADSGE